MRILQSEHPRPLNLLAVGPNGRVAAASCSFGVRSDVEVWDAAAGDLALTIEIADYGAAEAIAFLPGGDLLGGGSGFKIPILDAGSAEVVAEVPLTLGRPNFALSASGGRLIVASSWNQHGALECFALEPNRVVRRLWVEGGPPLQFGWYYAPAMTRDGASVAVLESAPDSSDGRPRSAVTIRAAASGAVATAVALDPADPVRQLAFTADGAKLLARFDSRTVRLFDANTGAPAGELVHRGRPFVTAVAVHPRGPVACARTDGTVTFWDADKLTQLRTLDWKAGKLVSLAFSPDGALGAAGTEDGKVVVWDVDV